MIYINKTNLVEVYFLGIDVYTILEIKDIVTPIFKEYNIKQAYLVGDYARGTALYYSSIDFFIEQADFSFLMPVSSIHFQLEYALKRKVQIYTKSNFDKHRTKNNPNETLLIFDVSAPDC